MKEGDGFETEEEYEQRVPRGRRPIIRSKPKKKKSSALGSRNFTIDDMVKDGHSKVKHWEAATVQSDTALIDALCQALVIYRQDAKDGNNALQSIYRENKLRVITRKGNPYTPLVKLLFGRERAASTVTRWSQVLEVAAGEFTGIDDVEPKSFRDFVMNAGGVEACAKLVRRSNALPLVSSKIDAALDATLAEGRAAGAVVQVTKCEDMPDEKFSYLVLEKTDAGYFRHKWRAMTIAELKRALSTGTVRKTPSRPMRRSPKSAREG